MTKTISLADDAYDALVSVKGPKESFSELARRLAADAKRRHLFDRTRKPLLTGKQADEMQARLRVWRGEGMEPRHAW